ncbi:LysR family transcriptional regulator [Aureimonas endophytica]|uniref:LysR family transcriptional regulator n=1 Tax=Aureimonas endophytica TaxID=2027858 RepID=A0A916ZUT8_9HYPH|nr:LysR family transcriptional regulator [Aureimonas endophytica]
MNWDDLRFFLAVARTGQILAASQRLGVNHATVARRIDSLEAGLNAKLLLRRPTGCSLTDAGVALLASAERIEAEMLAARGALGDRDIRLAGTVRVGAPDGFGTAFLAARLWRLTVDHPDLVIQLVPVPRSFSLSQREADVAITLERPAQGRLVSRKLTDYTLGLYASADYLEQQGRPRELRDLAAHRLVGHVEDLVYTKSLHYAGDVMPGWVASFEVSSALGQAEAVAAGAGIGILHGFVARREAALTRILPEIAIRRSYWLVTHESAAALAPVRHVAEGIVDLVRRERAAFGDDAPSLEGPPVEAGGRAGSQTKVPPR